MSSKYDNETRAGYQDAQRARAYKYRTQRITWARFTTARELELVQAMLAEYVVEDGEAVLDAPCGTGIAGPLLGQAGVRVVALDIALEMMALARGEYRADDFSGFFFSVHCCDSGVPTSSISVTFELTV